MTVVRDFISVTFAIILGMLMHQHLDYFRGAEINFWTFYFSTVFIIPFVLCLISKKTILIVSILPMTVAFAISIYQRPFLIDSSQILGTFVYFLLAAIPSASVGLIVWAYRKEKSEKNIIL